MLPSEREMIRKLDEDEATTRTPAQKRFTSLQPTYEDSVPPSSHDDDTAWDDRD